MAERRPRRATGSVGQRGDRRAAAQGRGQRGRTTLGRVDDRAAARRRAAGRRSRRPRLVSDRTAALGEDAAPVIAAAHGVRHRAADPVPRHRPCAQGHGLAGRGRLGGVEPVPGLLRGRARAVAAGRGRGRRAWAGPTPVRDRIPVNCTIPAVGPERGARDGPGRRAAGPPRSRSPSRARSLGRRPRPGRGGPGRARPGRPGPGRRQRGLGRRRGARRASAAAPASTWSTPSSPARTVEELAELRVGWPGPGSTCRSRPTSRSGGPRTPTGSPRWGGRRRGAQGPAARRGPGLPGDRRADRAAGGGVQRAGDLGRAPRRAGAGRRAARAAVRLRAQHRRPARPTTWSTAPLVAVGRRASRWSTSRSTPDALARTRARRRIAAVLAGSAHGRPATLLAACAWLTRPRCARVIVAALLAGGVREVVLAPGSRSAPLAYALCEADRAGLLRLHVRIDERTAGFLALGLAKASGAPGRGGHHLGDRRGQPAPGRARGLARHSAGRGHRRPAAVADEHRRQPDHRPGPAVRPARPGVAGAGRRRPTTRRPGGSRSAGCWPPPPGARTRRPGPVHLNVELSEPLVRRAPPTAPRRPLADADSPVGRGPAGRSAAPRPGPQTVVVAGDAAAGGRPRGGRAGRGGRASRCSPSRPATPGGGPAALATYRLLLGSSAGRGDRAGRRGRAPDPVPAGHPAAGPDRRRAGRGRRPYADWVDPGRPAARWSTRSTCAGPRRTAAWLAGLAGGRRRAARPRLDAAARRADPP